VFRSKFLVENLNIRELRIHDPMRFIFKTSSNTLEYTRQTFGNNRFAICKAVVKSLISGFTIGNLTTKPLTLPAIDHNPSVLTIIVFHYNLFSRRYSSVTRNMSPMVARSESSLQNKLLVTASPSMYRTLGVR
jgi:hypothetical protein